MTTLLTVRCPDRCRLATVTNDHAGMVLTVHQAARPAHPTGSEPAILTRSGPLARPPAEPSTFARRTEWTTAVAHHTTCQHGAWSFSDVHLWAALDRCAPELTLQRRTPLKPLR